MTNIYFLYFIFSGFLFLIFYFYENIYIKSNPDIVADERMPFGLFKRTAEKRPDYVSFKRRMSGRCLYFRLSSFFWQRHFVVVPFCFRFSGACFYGGRYRVGSCGKTEEKTKMKTAPVCGAFSYFNKAPLFTKILIRFTVDDVMKEDIFDRLSRSDFRSRFRLKEKELEYIRQKGMDTIRRHAEDFIARRLAPALPAHDGKQTPMHGHPVFIAQHATATCCRGCLCKWHGIPAGRELSAGEQAYIVDVIMEWIRRQTV